MSILSIEVPGGPHVLKLRGPLTAGQAESVIQVFRDLFERGVQKMIVDMAEVPFVDSRGLAALISGYKLFGSDSRNFKLAAPQDQPQLLFELTGFNRFFQILEQLPPAMMAESKAAVALL